MILSLIITFFIGWQLLINKKINKMSKFVNSITSFKQINGSPTNNSTSKNLWSFPKQPRFKANSPYCDKIYDKDSTFRKTGTSIGLGNKFDFTKDQTCSPGASKYTIDAQIDTNIKKKRGFSMSVGRDDSPQKGYIPIQPLRFPGSTKYDNLRLPSGHTYSIRHRTKVHDKTMTIQPQNNYPGPGNYQNPQFQGKSLASRFRSTQKYSLNQKTRRFFEFKNNNPGPGDYSEINQFSDKGQYPLSKTIGYGKRFFDKEKRQSQFGKTARFNIAPGPGSYKIPSEFGYY